mgnify:FL=1
MKPIATRSASPSTPAQPAVGAEVMTVTRRKVHCDGPEFSKHPRIYLTIGPDGQVVCPYCSRQFVLAAGTTMADEH